MAYISKHQQRKQTITTSKFESTGSIERYDYYYDLCYEGILRNVFPIILLTAGQVLMRKVAWNASENRYFNSEESRQIPPARLSSLSQSVRYSGMRLDGKPGQGALYTGTLAGVLRETAYYTREGSSLSTFESPDRMKSRIAEIKSLPADAVKDDEGNPYHVYRLLSPIRLADIRVTTLCDYFRRAGAASSGTGDLGIQQVYDGYDYSAARGIADAVHDAGMTKGVRGVCANSSRMDSDLHFNVTNHGDATGGLVVAIFGQAGSTVSELLPVKSFSDFKGMAKYVQPCMIV